MKASKKVANHNGMNDTNVAPIVTIHKAGVNFNLCHILVNADPAAIKLTALAVVDVITITNKAIIPKPSFDAIVDGSESFGSNALFIKAVAIVAVKPMKANQNSPMLAPKNDQPVAPDLRFVKREKSDDAVTQARLKAAKISIAAPDEIRTFAGGVQAKISANDTCWKTTIDSQITKIATKIIPIRSIIRTERSPNEIDAKCNNDMMIIPMTKPALPPAV
ncbi:hypothetical protein WEIDD23_01427 [Weissella sp. DD23]|nr:hypothetical protein WEIDD23_01427 [Weissella sp. DD23]